MYKDNACAVNKKPKDEIIYTLNANHFDNKKLANMTFTQAFNENFLTSTEDDFPSNKKEKKNQRINKSNIEIEKAKRRIGPSNKKTDSMIINKEEFEKMNNDILLMDKVNHPKKENNEKRIHKNRSMSKESTNKKFYKKFQLKINSDIDNDCRENLLEEEENNSEKISEDKDNQNTKNNPPNKPPKNKFAKISTNPGKTKIQNNLVTPTDKKRLLRKSAKQKSIEDLNYTTTPNPISFNSSKKNNKAESKEIISNQNINNNLLNKTNKPNNILLKTDNPNKYIQTESK